MSQQCIEICSQICNNKYGGTNMDKDLKQINNSKGKSGFTLAEVFSVHPKDVRKHAFTLAEVLITLGIIGVVAAMTLPVLIQKHQKRVLEKQFIKAYSLISQAAKKAEADLGFTPECYYWNKRPYGVARCAERNSSGNCTRKELPDGSPLPSDYNGRYNDCKIFGEAIIKNLKIIKTCENNAVAGGCIVDIEGNDSIIAKANPDLSEYDLNVAISCGYWRKNNIKTKTAFVIADGVTLFNYHNYSYFHPHLFAIDINGLKGPNKWGHDIFSFYSKGNITGGIKFVGDGCNLIESGGISATQMLKNAYK